MYDLTKLNLPVLSGQQLRLFARSLESRLGESLLIPKLLGDSGISRLGPQKIDEPPTYKPLVTPKEHPSAENLFEEFSESVMARKQSVPFHTVSDYANAYRHGHITPSDVAELFLNGVASLQQGKRPLNAFINIMADDLRRQAKESTERFKSGTPLTIFDGVPIGVKDEMDMLPYPTTVGTTFLGQEPATSDSTVVTRLRQAGALLLGKCNMYEIGISPEGFNAHYGTVRNPYNLNHDSGGSSSGSAAAVAAGLCPVSIGADGGGSIRVPAAHCGLVGLKGTYGRISSYGSAPLDWSVGHIGPIAASVTDIALTYLLIAGQDEQDENTLQQPTPIIGNFMDDDLSGMTVGIYDHWNNHADAEIVQTCEQMIAHFQARGATVRSIEVAGLDNMRVAHAVTILSEMATSMGNFKAPNEAFAPPTRVNLAVGRSTTARDFLQSQRVRTRALSTFASLFEDVDVIVTPTTAVTAPPIPPRGESYGWSNLNVVTEVMRYVFVGNLIGLPAITFPMGYSQAGLPIGMQVMANHWQEHLLFKMAYTAEMALAHQRPSTFIEMLPHPHPSPEGDKS